MIKLGMVDIAFKVKLSQTASIREINDMLMSIKRYPSVSSVVMYTGDEILAESSYVSSMGKEAKLYPSENDDKVRQFPSE